MADLSNLLGDVYGDPEPEPAVVAAAPVAPAWADDHHLDEAFATWKPEPLTPVLADVASTPSPAASAPLDDDLAAALSAALAEAPRATAVAPPLPDPVEAPVPSVPPVDVAPEPVAAVAPVAPEPVAVVGWQRTDDDILPRGVKKSSFRLR